MHLYHIPFTDIHLFLFPLYLFFNMSIPFTDIHLYNIFPLSIYLFFSIYISIDTFTKSQKQQMIKEFFGSEFSLSPQNQQEQTKKQLISSILDTTSKDASSSSSKSTSSTNNANTNTDTIALSQTLYTVLTTEPQQLKRKAILQSVYTYISRFLDKQLTQRSIFHTLLRQYLCNSNYTMIQQMYILYYTHMHIYMSL